MRVDATARYAHLAVELVRLAQDDETQNLTQSSE